MLKYNESSLSGLTRRGKRAGYKHKTGYWVVRLNGVKYYAHRLVWMLNHGEIPDDLYVDHKDGNKDNNKIGNLRLVTPQESSRNLKMFSSNTSGVTCVFYRERRGIGYWIARWQEDGKQREKHFSLNTHGDSARVKAEAYRELKLSESGSMYTERHGRQE